MKGVRYLVAGLALVLGLGGCSTVNLLPFSGLPQNVASDAKRANELFIKYGDPAEAQCATFMNTVIDGIQSKDAALAQLKAESTNGLLSKGAQTILEAQILRKSGVDSAQEFRKGFQANCSAVNAEVLALIMSRGLSTGN